MNLRERHGKEHPNFKGNKWDICGAIAYGYDSKGNKFVIDVMDYNDCSNFCWSLSASGRHSKSGGYFCARKSRADDHKTMMLHNYIWVKHNCEIPSGYMVDHIDQDPANNKLSNLRLVTKSGNAINCAVRSHNKTGVTGVCWNSSKNGWRAYLTYDKKRIELGVYKNFNDAVKTRHDAEIQYFGELRSTK